MNKKIKKLLQHKLHARQKRKFADSILEWGNLVFVGSILQQVMMKQKIDLIGFVGFALWITTLVVGTFLS